MTRAEARTNAAEDALKAGEAEARAASDAERAAERARAEPPKPVPVPKRSAMPRKTSPAATDRIAEDLDKTPEALLEDLADRP